MLINEPASERWIPVEIFSVRPQKSPSGFVVLVFSASRLLNKFELDFLKEHIHSGLFYLNCIKAVFTSTQLCRRNN